MASHTNSPVPRQTVSQHGKFGSLPVGPLPDFESRVAVIGGGISGLLAVDWLLQRGCQVTLFEAQPRLGGLIETVEHPLGLAESAAHSVQASAVFRDFAERLGVKLVRVENKARWIARGGRLRKFPLGPIEGASLLWRLSSQKVHREYGSMAEWGARHLGQAGLDYLFRPFVQGIYACRPEELAVEAAFPSLVSNPGKSLLVGKFKRASSSSPRPTRRSSMMTVAGGMGQLVRAMICAFEKQPKFRSVLGQPIGSLHELLNHGSFDHVVLATPAGEAARWLDSVPGLGARVGDYLRIITYAPLVSATVFCNKRMFTQGPPQGVGVLIPESERSDILGVLFNSSSFSDRVKDPQATVSLTVMLGGTLAPRWIERADTEIREVIRRELGKILGYQGSCDDSLIFRWPRAIPIYNRELKRAIDEAGEALSALAEPHGPRISLVGNYSGQVSIRGMVEALAKAQASKENIAGTS